MRWPISVSWLPNLIGGGSSIECLPSSLGFRISTLAGTGDSRAQTSSTSCPIANKDQGSMPNEEEKRNIKVRTNLTGGFGTIEMQSRFTNGWRFKTMVVVMEAVINRGVAYAALN